MENKELRKIDVGLDIGIASVGWCITDAKTLEIIKHGVRLFETVDDPKDSKLENANRREKRSARRQINRRVTLKRDYVKSLIENKLVSDIEFDKKNRDWVAQYVQKYIENKDIKTQLASEAKSKYGSEYGNDAATIYPFLLRKEGLERQLSDTEMHIVLYWYIHHRGFKYEIKTKNEKNKDEQVNNELIEKNKFPVFTQLNHFKDFKHIAGDINRSFHKNDYIAEIDELFKCQSQIWKNYQDKFKETFERQRSFEEGPGNDKTPTQYGRFFEVIKGKLERLPQPLGSLWERTLGKCSVFPEEDRAPKNSLAAEIFNLLNDLNNVWIGDSPKKKEHLSTKLKLELIKISTEVKGNTKKILKKISDEYDVNEDKIHGYRINAKREPIFTELKTFFAIKKPSGGKKSKKDKETAKDIELKLTFKDIFQDGKFIENNCFDQIAPLFQKTQEVEKRLIELQKLKEAKILKFSDDELKALSQTTESFSQTHALSFKAIRQMIPILVNENKNQMEILQEYVNSGQSKDLNDYGVEMLANEWVEKTITTPTVKRSLRQAIKIFNAILELSKKEGWTIDNIVIEMARDHNNKQAREKIQNLQAFRADTNKAIENYLKARPYLPSSAIEKIWLFSQQKCHDAYTGQKVEIEYFLDHLHEFDIDHIIPYSQSFDNSRSNKVVANKHSNSQKGNRTPHQFLASEKFVEMSKRWEDWYLKSDNPVFRDKEKLQYLKTDIDYSNPENTLGFIQRNIVDTRYTTRELFNALNGFKKANNLSFKVKAINGKMTSFARRQMNKNKDDKLRKPAHIEEIIKKMEQDKEDKKSRIWHGHHAEDAYIITVLNHHFRDSKSIEWILGNPGIQFDKLSPNKENRVFEAHINSNFSDLIADLDKGRAELNSKMDKMRFSRMVTPKQNVQFYNESLYGARQSKDDIDSVHKVVKLKLIDMSKSDAEKYFSRDKNQEEQKEIEKIMPMAEHDKPTYKLLQDIYHANADKAKPFMEAIPKGINKPKYVEARFTNKKGQEVIRNVESVTVIKETKKKEDLVYANNNGQSFYDGLNWVSLHIFKTKKGKWSVIPATAFNHKFRKLPNGKTEITPISDRLKLQKIAKGIDENEEPAVVINKNDILCDPQGKEFFFVCGVEKSSEKLEVKPLTWNKTLVKKGQDYRTLNTALKSWKLLKLSIFGDYEAENDVIFSF